MNAFKTDLKSTSSVKLNTIKSGKCDKDNWYSDNFWTIFLFNEESTEISVDFKVIMLHGNCVYFIRPNQIQHIEINANAYILTFSDDFIFSNEETTALMLELPSHQFYDFLQVLHLTSEKFLYLWQLLKLMENEYSSAEEVNFIVLMNYLNVFFLKCNEFLKPNVEPKSIENRDIELFFKFKNAIEQEYKKEHSIQEYADKLCVTTKKLGAICSTFTGLTPLAYLHQRLLTEAKSLLLEQQSAIKEIAFELNFSDAAHFTKFFKQKTGILPSDYKIKNNFCQKNE